MANFSAIEARVNAVVMAKLANTTAVCNGVDIDGIFYKTTETLLERVQNNVPHFECKTIDANLAEADSGSVMTIDGVNYEINQVDNEDGFVLYELNKQ